MLKSFTAIANAIRTAVGGLLQVTGPSTGTTRTMTVPDANFTVARTDAAQTFTGNQTINGLVIGGLTSRYVGYIPGTTTPSVSGVSTLFIANSVATSITNFTNAVAGQLLFLKFEDANTTITRNNAYLDGASNFTSSANATLTLIFDGSNWYEVCRSTTNG